MWHYNAREATQEELQSSHAQAYIDRLKNAHKQLDGEQLQFLDDDNDTYMNPHSLLAAKLAAGVFGSWHSG